MRWCYNTHGFLCQGHVQGDDVTLAGQSDWIIDISGECSARQGYVDVIGQ